MRYSFDVAIIGGGINGCGIAADASGRGLDVVLLEQADLASGTSSASSKLIHGGLRYLEHFAFGLVAHALAEREILLANAPHIIWPLRFVVPHVPQMRSRMLMRAGLLLYDHLARRRLLPPSRALELSRSGAGRPLRRDLRHGFAYWDCWVDDARLVALVARLAAEHGATIATRTRVVSARAEDGRWRLRAAPDGGAPYEIEAAALVNAAGPWAASLGRDAIRRGNAAPAVPMRLVKGSHIVVPRIDGADDAYLLQAPDRRVVFVLPFEDAFTLIGTTDVPFSGDPAAAQASDGEADYLLEVANRFLAVPLVRQDIVWRFAGVRPLYDDASSDPAAVTRDYRLDLDAPRGAPPLLTVVGGKVTTYRLLAESALDLLAQHLPKRVGPAWTSTARLAGGDFPDGDRARFEAQLRRDRPGLSPRLVCDLVRRYGTLARGIIGEARCDDDLGPDLGGGVRPREVEHLQSNEWARTAQDVLWRRTKAGLRLGPDDLDAASARIDEVLRAGAGNR